MFLSKSTAIKPLALIFFTLFSFSLFANNFSDYINSIPYNSVKEKLYPVEKREFDKISFEGSTPVFTDKLIRLYLVASGITDEESFAGYMKKFETLVTQSRRVQGIGKLNRYNKAEALLHFLHDTLFKVELTGSAAGYNIGIKETFDKKQFNCYKSALIYNALLEYYGYTSYLVLVPEHIYSVVIIGNKEIPVETTNRYGFDPFNEGSPDFSRRLDKPNVTLNRKRYRHKSPIDNVSAAGIIYNNLLLLYAGRVRYSGVTVQTDLERASLLGILGLYITRKDKALATNVQIPFFDITETAVKQSPENLEQEYNNFLEIISQPYISPYSQAFKRNISILVLDYLPAWREAAFGKPSEISIQKLALSYRDSLLLLERLSLDGSITKSGWNNSIIFFMKELGPKTDRTSYTGIINFINTTYSLLNSESLQKSPYYNEHRTLLAQYATVELNNYIIDLIQKQKYSQAYDESEKGIEYLEKLDFFHPATLKVLKKNRELIKQYL